MTDTPPKAHDLARKDALLCAARWHVCDCGPCTADHLAWVERMVAAAAAAAREANQ